MALRHRDLCNLILYELYWMAAEPEGINEIPPNDFYELVSDRTSYLFFEAAITTIGENGLIEKSGVLPDKMAITQKGILIVEQELENPNSFLFIEHLERENTGVVPASDRTVQLDHNSPAYARALSTGEELIVEVKFSNSFADEERDRRLAELEAGYRLLKASKADPRSIRSVLGAVLMHLVKKFADEPVGQLAKLAWSSLKALMGWP